MVFSQNVTSEDEWGFHSAKVNCVAWSPDSTLVASGSLDTSIIVWSVEKPNKRLVIKSKESFVLYYIIFFFCCSIFLLRFLFVDPLALIDDVT